LFSVPMRLAVRPGHPLRRVRRLRPLLDADWLVLDPLDDPGSPISSLMRLHRLEIPRRIVQSASNLLGLQLATKTDLISMWSDFVFRGTGGPLRMDPGSLEVLPMEDELPDFNVYLVYRSMDLMTHVCAEFSKEIRHFAEGYRPDGRDRLHAALPVLAGRDAGPFLECAVEGAQLGKAQPQRHLLQRQA
jgi:DNA-binding transcriptional LysR family regulator